MRKIKTILAASLITFFSTMAMATSYSALSSMETQVAKAPNTPYAIMMTGESTPGVKIDGSKLTILRNGDYYFNAAAQVGGNTTGDVYLWLRLNGKDIPPQVQKGGNYHLEMIADFGCAFLNRFKDQPMFLYLAFRGPHVPLDATKKYLDRFQGEMPDERRKALGAISCIDDGIGKIMDTLRKNGIEENTLIFLIGDNGAGFDFQIESKKQSLGLPLIRDLAESADIEAKYPQVKQATYSFIIQF